MRGRGATEKRLNVKGESSANQISYSAGPLDLSATAGFQCRKLTLGRNDRHGETEECWLRSFSFCARGKGSDRHFGCDRREETSRRTHRTRVANERPADCHYRCLSLKHNPPTLPTSAHSEHASHAGHGGSYGDHCITRCLALTPNPL